MQWPILLKKLTQVLLNHHWIHWLAASITKYYGLTHWGWVTHRCVGKLTIFGSDNGLLPDRRQAIIWTSAGILLNGPLQTNFSEILNWNSNIFIQENAVENVVCEMAAILSQPQCVNTLKLRQNVRHFTDDIFKGILLNENVWISTTISLKYIP